MPNVIEELSVEDGALDYGHVLNRVIDWRNRIDALYRDITSWLADYRADQNDTVEMNEAIMREYGVPSVRLPILRFSDVSGQVAKFIPSGLWIIGANGRIDLFSKRGQFILFDRADNFALPVWDIAPSLQRQETKRLSADGLLSTVR